MLVSQKKEWKWSGFDLKEFYRFFPWNSHHRFRINHVYPRKEYLHEIVEVKGPVYSTMYVPGFLVLLMFTIGLGTLIFSPTWFLTDAGVVYSNEERVARTDQPVEGRIVGGRFTDFLRGYIGIGVVF